MDHWLHRIESDQRLHRGGAGAPHAAGTTRQSRVHTCASAAGTCRAPEAAHARTANGRSHRAMRRDSQRRAALHWPFDSKTPVQDLLRIGLMLAASAVVAGAFAPSAQADSVPTGLPPSPLMGATKFSQPM